MAALIAAVFWYALIVSNNSIGEGGFAGPELLFADVLFCSFAMKGEYGDVQSPGNELSGYARKLAKLHNEFLMARSQLANDEEQREIVNELHEQTAEY